MVLRVCITKHNLEQNNVLGTGKSLKTATGKVAVGLEDKGSLKKLLSVFVYCNKSYSISTLLNGKQKFFSVIVSFFTKIETN